MNWRKLGLVFTPSGQRPWMQSHAANPVALGLGGDLYRAYFATRDDHNRSHVGYVEFNLTRPQQTLRLSDQPVLSPGPLGYFDDHGVYASSIVAHENKLLLYYMGWNPGLREPMFYTSIGVAVSEDNGETFRKLFKSPILSRSEFDPWMVSAPFVMLDNERWRMWYISGFKWEETEGELRSFYHIKYAESDDGIRWERQGIVSLELQPGERNIARPCAIKGKNGYQAWYSHNAGKGYRIGYAESDDGYAWTRLDSQAGISVSESGWDSEALAYPWVFVHGDRKYMLYNGNNFGREGFGLAVEET
jgi:predicted GH43/DUF377 family glycosyl hydrolase